MAETMTPPGVCCVDQKTITDAPETIVKLKRVGTHRGYMAIFPRRDGEGNVLYDTEQGDNNRQGLRERVPPHRRVLCREHYVEEWREKYPDLALPEFDLALTEA